MNKIAITPIGTCRVSTPLLRGATRYPIRVDLQRIYGFVHTSEEALQQLHYRRGERTIPDHIAPLLFRPGDPAWSLPPQQQAADMTIVEISSIKSYKVGDVAVQSNYLSRHFADFFASPQRSRVFWGLATSADRAGLRELIDQYAAAHPCSAQDRELLEQISFRTQSFDEVFAEMEELCEILGKDRLLFVTHVNARPPDGELIAARDKVVRWVKLASQRLGVECFDPTALMLEFGQERAMERGGLDLMHYTNPFYDHWYAAMQKEYLLPRMEGRWEGQDTSALEAAIQAETISAAIESGDIVGGARSLFAALKAYPDFLPLVLLHGRVLEQIGDYDRGLKVLLPHADAEELTVEVRQSLMRVLLETGDADAALAVARQMLADEYENEQIYETAAIACERLGLTGDALRYRKLAFRLNPGNHAAAVAVLSGYSQAGDEPRYQSWLDEVAGLVENGGDGPSALALAEWALSAGKADTLGRMLPVLARVDMVHFPSVIESVIAAGQESALLPAAAALGALPNLTDKSRRALQPLALAWLGRAAQALDAGDLKDAYACAAASLAVLERNGPALKLQRSVLEALRQQVRAAKAVPAEIVALCLPLGDPALSHRGIGIPFANALVAEKRLVEAEDVFRRLFEAMPDDAEVQSGYAHVAGLNGSFRVALELYGNLLQAGESLNERVSIRRDRFMGQAQAKGLRHIRQLVADDNYEEAICTARAMERFMGACDLVDAELQGIARSLRGYLRRLDDDSGGAANSLPVLRMILSINPDDPASLRRAALETMKAGEHGQSLEFWQRLDAVSPGQPVIASNIKRCETQMRRQATALTGV